MNTARRTNEIPPRGPCAQNDNMYSTNSARGSIKARKKIRSSHASQIHYPHGQQRLQDATQTRIPPQTPFGISSPAQPNEMPKQKPPSHQACRHTEAGLFRKTHRTKQNQHYSYCNNIAQKRHPLQRNFSQPQQQVNQRCKQKTGNEEATAVADKLRPTRRPMNPLRQSINIQQSRNRSQR